MTVSVPASCHQRREAWEGWYKPVAAARVDSALWHALAGRFSARLCGRRGVCVIGCWATPGDVLLVLAAGSRLSAYIAATVGEIGFLRGIWLDGSMRLAWLEDYAAALVHDADVPVPMGSKKESALIACHSPTPAPSGSYSKT